MVYDIINITTRLRRGGECVMKMNWFEMLTWVLVIVGALNWGLVGFFDYNLVDELLGAGSMGAKVVYDLVGLSALYMIFTMVMKSGK